MCLSGTPMPGRPELSKKVNDHFSPVSVNHEERAGTLCALERKCGCALVQVPPADLGGAVNGQKCQ